MPGGAGLPPEVWTLPNPGRFSPDHTRVVIDNEDSIEVWDAATRRPVAQHAVGFDITALTAVHRAGQNLVVIGGDDTVAVWELPAGRQRFRVSGAREGSAGAARG